MKKLTFIYSFIFMLFVVVGCTQKDGIDQDLKFLDNAVSGNVNKIFDISNDNSGKVKITPTGNGVTSFVISFGHGTGSGASATVLAGASATHVYPEGDYTVSIVTADIAGHETTATYPLKVTYRAPEKLLVTTSGVGAIKVSATALYANSFLVYYGDVAGEVGTPMAVGQELPAHAYPDGGPFDLKVVALSGGAATIQSIKTLFGLPATFEIATMNYFFGTFGSGQLFATVANPNATGLNTSAKVGKFTRGSEGWSGTYSPLDIPISFASGKKIKMLAYNPDPALVGKKLNVELEAAVGGSPANGVAVLKVAFTTSGAWEELVFDFSTIAAIPVSAKFGQLVLRFNDSSDGAGAVIYVDNIRLTN